MKLHGVVKGKTIELATDPELPEGQPVLVELEIPTPEFNADPLSDRDLEKQDSHRPLASRTSGRPGRSGKQLPHDWEEACSTRST